MYKFFNRCSVVVAISAVCVVLLFFLERDNRSVPFAIAVVLTLTVLIFNFTQRVRASLLLSWCIVFIVAAISLTKQRLMGFNVHVFDLLTFATDSDSLHFVLIKLLEDAYPFACCAIAGGLVRARPFSCRQTLAYRSSLAPCRNFLCSRFPDDQLPAIAW